MLIEKIDAALVVRAQKRDEEKSNPLRLSNAGICARRLAYQLHGIPHDEQPNPRRQRTFDFGVATEECVRGWCKEAGLELQMVQAATSLDCGVEPETLRVEGHIDGAFQLDDNLWLLECKSINTDGFQRTVVGVPDYSYICQVQAYMAASGIPRALVIYCDKNDQNLHEVELLPDPELVEVIKARFRRVAASTPDNLPDREHEPEAEKEFVRCSKTRPIPAGVPLMDKRKTGWYKPTGRRILPFECAYCPWKKPCWGVGEPEFKENGKPYWTVQDTALGEFMR